MSREADKRLEGNVQEVVEPTPPPGYVETPIVDPSKPSSTRRARIAIAKLDRYREKGPFFKYYEALYPVRDTLADPEYILAYKEDDWDGYCYARRVTSGRNNDGTERAYEEGFTFVVFVTKTLKVIEWGFEPCDRWDRPGMPADLRDGHMGEVLWPR